jgi:drug/metabolite transporter (DMT)-like permease
MKLSNRQLAILALAGACIIWGAASPIFKWSMQEIPPYTLAFLRFMLAAVFVLPFVYKNLTIHKSDFNKILTLAAVGITLHIALYFVGLQLTSSINVPILSAIMPILLILGSIWYLKEKLKKRFIIGSGISVIGILIITVEPLLVTGPDGSIPGNILIILSVLCGVIYTLLLKKYSLPYSSLTIVFWTFLLGALLFLPAFATELMLLNPFANFDEKAIIGVGFGAIFSSAIAYFLYAFGLKYLTASEAGIFIYLEPIITVLVAVPLLHEIVHPTYIIGSLVVFAGLFIAEVHRHRHHHLRHHLHPLKEHHHP